MAMTTILTGLVLIVLGLLGYLNATPDAEGKVSPTALIPAGVGLVIFVCGLLAIRPGLRKHAMHLAAVMGVLGFLGGFMPIIRQQMKGNPLNLTAPSALVGFFMAAVCFAFVALCVKSFIDARRARRAAAGVAS